MACWAVVLWAVLCAFHGAARAHDEATGEPCVNDMLVEPYHQTVIQGIDAVHKTAHASLNPNNQIGWQAGQTDMNEAEAAPYLNGAELATNAATSPAPIRIKIDYQIDSKTSKAAEMHLKSKLLPKMVASLRQFIQIKQPVHGPLFLPRTCMEASESDPEACVAAAPVTKCGTVAYHNLDYFGDYRECNPDTGDCKYIKGGTGVPGTDFVLYVTTELTSHCNRGLLAFAGYCVLDVGSSRPLAGFANFCPNSLSTAPQKFQAQLETAVHETLHALAFSTTLFGKFIGWDGQPLGVTNVLQYFSENGKVVKKMVTPTVLREVRDHFGCPTLNGAEIENEGGPGIAGSHWESRLFQYEIMDGQAGNSMDYERHVVSRLTLAVLQDTGWYLPIWKAGKSLTVGRNAGCAFVMDDCTNPSTQTGKEYYCTEPVDKCVYDRTAQGSCDMDYFLMDGCSYVRPYVNTVCTNSSHMKLSAMLWGQGYGSQARCLEHDTDIDFERASVGSLTPPAVGCYHMTCDTAGASVYLVIFGEYVECPAGQYVDLASINNSGFRSGSVGPCPTAESLCPSLQCDNACSDQGRCVDGVCECYLGFTGSDCSVETCTLSSCLDGQWCNAFSGTCNGTPIGGQTEADPVKLLVDVPGIIQLKSGEWVYAVDTNYPAGMSGDEPGLYSADGSLIPVQLQDSSGLFPNPTDPQISSIDVTTIVAISAGCLCVGVVGAIIAVIKLRSAQPPDRNVRAVELPTSESRVKLTQTETSFRSGSIRQFGTESLIGSVRSAPGGSRVDAQFAMAEEGHLISGGSARTSPLIFSSHPVSASAGASLRDVDVVYSPEIFSMPCPPANAMPPNGSSILQQ